MAAHLRSGVLFFGGARAATLSRSPEKERLIAGYFKASYASSQALCQHRRLGSELESRRNLGN